MTTNETEILKSVSAVCDHKYHYSTPKGKLCCCTFLKHIFKEVDEVLK